MGMDVIGKDPKNKIGEYFRRNVWAWRPLADYCCEVSPVAASVGDYWQTNDGKGLESEDTAMLAAVLREKLESGEVEKYVKARDLIINNLPREKCEHCNGTGVRTDTLGIRHKYHLKPIPKDARSECALIPGTIDDIDHFAKGDPHPRAGLIGWCNACNGIGTVKNSASHYTMDERDVVEFCEFLEMSGGFEIH